MPITSAKSSVAYHDCSTLLDYVEWLPMKRPSLSIERWLGKIETSTVRNDCSSAPNFVGLLPVKTQTILKKQRSKMAIQFVMLKLV